MIEDFDTKENNMDDARIAYKYSETAKSDESR